MCTKDKNYANKADGAIRMYLYTKHGFTPQFGLAARHLHIVAVIRVVRC
jgi:hypothetical protein